MVAESKLGGKKKGEKVTSREFLRSNWVQGHILVLGIVKVACGLCLKQIKIACVTNQLYLFVGLYCRFCNIEPSVQKKKKRMKNIVYETLFLLFRDGKT